LREVYNVASVVGTFSLTPIFVAGCVHHLEAELSDSLLEALVLTIE
jgi:hypothetical protein